MLNYFRKRILDKRAKILNLKKSSKFISNKFNFLNFQHKSYGEKNSNKFFFVIRRTPGAGFFSNLNTCLSAYNKKQEFNGGYIYAKKIECKNFDTNILNDLYSEIKIENQL